MFFLPFPPFLLSISFLLISLVVAIVFIAVCVLLSWCNCLGISSEKEKAWHCSKYRPTLFHRTQASTLSLLALSFILWQRYCCR
jgi:hypothetical protein